MRWVRDPLEKQLGAFLRRKRGDTTSGSSPRNSVCRPQRFIGWKNASKASRCAASNKS